MLEQLRDRVLEEIEIFEKNIRFNEGFNDPTLEGAFVYYLVDMRLNIERLFEGFTHEQQGYG